MTGLRSEGQVRAHSGKRLFDLTLAVLALPWLLGLMAVVALLVRHRLGSPVLFRHQRPGFLGRPFTLYKFRTMTESRSGLPEAQADADRLTSFGRFLRSTSLDELPQLFNVLRGDMSLVGPRPLLMKYLPLYTLEQARRHEVRPGITGWAQVNGRNAISWEDKLALDVWYVDHRTLGLDLGILGMTVWKAVTREGISQRDHVTSQEFMGNQD